MNIPRIAAAIVAAVLTAPHPALAGDFMDTRITWVFGDDDFLAGAGEKIPDSPLPSISDREGYELFFDNLDSRYSGRENQTHLVMYKMMPGFIANLTTEAAVVLQFDIFEGGSDFGDDGTYLKLHYHTGSMDSDDGVSVVFFPFDTERLRLGYLWDISWGGGAIFTNKRRCWSPGAKVAFQHGIFDAFVGFKTAKISMVQEETSGGQPLNVQDTAYGFLGGAGVDLANAFRIDLGAGYFQQGTFEFNGLVGRPVYTAGFSLRLAYHLGREVSMPADYALYRNEPDAQDQLVPAPVLEGGEETEKTKEFSLQISAEGTVLIQHLADPDSFGSTVVQPAYTAALQFLMAYGGLSAHVTGFYRSTTYILHTVPGFSPFWGLPNAVDTKDELFAALGVSYHFDRSHLTPSLILGIQAPATYSAGSTTVVIRDVNSRDILPTGEAREPIFSTRASLKWDLSEMMSIMLFLQYSRDYNRTRLVRDPDGTFRTFLSPDELGGALVAQARF
ncbi:MAG: hypothetical protein JRG91_04645 [Deltaproteobacteria bacterium]|nr:hypothetical protein [Deltaproteobacteria bacterium]